MSGHVFVIHGRIESVVHDVAIVPTDARGEVTSSWLSLLNGVSVGADELTELSRHGFSRSASDAIWFVDVGDSWAPSVGPPGVGDRLKSLVREIAGDRQGRPPASGGRVLPLIATPVLAIGEGGMSEQRGAMIKALLTSAEDAVRDHDVDVAFVIPEREVYGAVQHHRRKRQPQGGAYAKAESLGVMARNGQLALLIGAGASVPSGLPSWSALLETLAKRLPDVQKSIESLQDSPLDQAELIAQQLGDDLGPQVVKALFPDGHDVVRPSLAHALLAALRCREVITTNYDGLYEAAVQHAGGARPTELPAPVDNSPGSWILKMHGSYDKPGSIILTRSHMVRFDARAKPAGSVLQAIALTRHLLVVGASLRDDNVIRLFLEVAEYTRGAHSGPFATLLDIDGDDARASLWRGQINWVRLRKDGCHDVKQAARELEIFLDHVAMYASDDTSWLLDRRFDHLLKPHQREVAVKLREVAEEVSDLAREQGGATWHQLSRVLGEFGSREGER